MIKQTLLSLALLSLPCWNGAAAQGPDGMGDGLSEETPSIVRAVADPFAPFGRPATRASAAAPVFQVEESDRSGNFWIGAAVGAFAGLAYGESDPATRGVAALHLWIPLGALMGGLLFTAMGIG